jgi:hypothetical protein
MKQNATSLQSTIEEMKKIILVNLALSLALVLLLDFSVTKLKDNYHTWPEGDSAMGFTTTPRIFGNGDGVIVYMIGDSHTELVYPPITHQAGLLHRYLDEKGVTNTVVLYGRAQFNPTQMFGAIDLLKERYKPDLIVYNIYAGNDFAEMIRNDDRPRLDTVGGRTVLTPPSWNYYRPKGFKTRWPRDSWILMTLNSLTSDNMLIKTLAAPKSIELLSGSPIDGARYLRDLYRMKDERIKYSGAVPAQYLNQHYLQKTFAPEFENQVGFRIGLINGLIADVNAPVVFSWIPSAAAIEKIPPPDKPIHDDILKRLGVKGLTDAEIFSQEERLKSMFVRGMTNMKGFIDYSDDYRNADAKYDLYDKETIHIQGEARRIIAERTADEVVKLSKPRGATK